MEKPLPIIPTPTLQRPGTINLTTLTVEAYDHLRNFLTLQLTEDDSISNREDWVNACDAALREFGENVALGGWLTGFKRARLFKKASQRLQGSRKGSYNENVGVVNRTESAQNKLDGEHAAESVNGNTGRTSLDWADLQKVHLESLRVLVTKAASPTPKPRIRHLLLTVAPYGMQWPESSRFHASSVDCKFTPGKFSLPAPDAPDDEVDGVLYGLHEWDSECLWRFQNLSMCLTQTT